MRHRLIAPALCLFAAACGNGEETIVHPAVTHEDVQAFSSWNIDVATLRTVGDVPPAQRTVTISVDVDGELTVDGESVDLAGLRAALGERVGTESPLEPPDLDAVLVFDKTLPWRGAQVVMQECAAARIGRLFFAVRHAGDGSAGTFAAFLPNDRSESQAIGRASEIQKVVARVRPTGEPSDARGLGLVLAEVGARAASLPHVEIDASGHTPVELVLKLADAAAVAGASGLTFVGTPALVGEGGLVAEVERVRAEPPARHVSVFGEPLPLPAAPASAGERVTGAYAGFPRSPHEVVLEEELAELVEPDER